MTVTRKRNGGGAPTGAAGGVLAGSYPNPDFAPNPEFEGATIFDGGVVVEVAPALVVFQEWNEGATAFVAFLLDVTKTAAAAGSRLVAVQMDGEAAWSLEVTGAGRVAMRTNPGALADLGNGSAGMIASISDGAPGLGWGDIAAGGGSAFYLLSHNGTNWTVIGK